MTTTCTRGHLGTIAVLTALLVLSACGASGEGEGDADVETIGSQAAVELVAAREDVVVIDVRTPEEHDAGHLEDAELLDLSGGVFADRIGDLDRDATYVLYCRTGSRSAQAAAMMEDLGFTDVRDAGAFDDLAAAGAITGP